VAPKEAWKGGPPGSVKAPDALILPDPATRFARTATRLDSLAAGHPMKCIAHHLGITYRTVTFHKYRMMERLGISTNAGLMTYALKRNMGIRHDEGVRTA